jgi:prepilin-type N-terminal cleavage/methylation domain-containing protein/prepilin-type processing-associated H-X9-DG protein
MERNSVIGRGFTLIELLVVIGIIGVLASLLVSALSVAKGHARSVTCKNRLHQMGLALETYVNEHQNKYPYCWTTDYDPSLEGAIGRENTRFWWAKLMPYYPVKWTNATFHCPGYKGAVNGRTGSLMPFGSYAYNSEGVSVPNIPGTPFSSELGLGPPQDQVLNGHVRIKSSATPEPRIKVPSEILAIGESRFLNANVNGTPGGHDTLICGLLKLSKPWDSFAPYAFDPARHGKNYNLAFCDGHIEALNPLVLFDPSKTAAMWNSDHQPHPEFWVP